MVLLSEVAIAESVSTIPEQIVEEGDTATETIGKLFTVIAKGHELELLLNLSTTVTR